MSPINRHAAIANHALASLAQHLQQRGKTLASVLPNPFAAIQRKHQAMMRLHGVRTDSTAN